MDESLPAAVTSLKHRWLQKSGHLSHTVYRDTSLLFFLHSSQQAMGKGFLSLYLFNILSLLCNPGVKNRIIVNHYFQPVPGVTEQ